MSAQTYSGGCQCGAVRYETEIDLGEVMSCNCSRCQKLGWLLTFVGADSFRLTKGENATTDFKFNKHVINHRFCSTCGIESYADGTGPGGHAMVAINLRCLDGVDLESLNIKKIDGRRF
jgi:hypothetical protein